MDPMTAIFLVWLAMAATALPMGLIWRARFSTRARLRRRAQSLSARQARAAAQGGDDEASRRRLVRERLRELERERRSGAGGNRETVAQLIARSGLNIGLREFILASVVAGLVMAGLLGLWGMSWPVSLIGGAGMGTLPPRLYLRTLIHRREKAFTEGFADALDILVRGARSGLPVSECMRIVAVESADPVGPEFERIIEGQRVGMTLKQALARGVERMPLAELRFFAVVLTVQQQTGGNLAATLENLSEVLRSRKRLRDKVSAMSSEARASAAIIGALPFLACLALTLVSPTYMAPLFEERLGHLMITGGLVWMGLGILVMRAMINFDQ